MFLQIERGNVYLHVAGLAIYDPSTAPGGAVRFKDVLRFFAAQVSRQPLLRRRLVQVPLSLDRPYWIDDGELDVEFHVRHIALPHPGDWRQLCIQVARIHSRPLDRSKPLWEAYVIEGLHNVPGVPPGSFALYTKMHHALIDGESGTELNKALHSLTPEVPDLLFEESGRSPAGRPAAAFVRAVFARAGAEPAQGAGPCPFRVEHRGAARLARRRRRLGRHAQGIARTAALRRPGLAAAKDAAADPLQRARVRAPRRRGRRTAARRDQDRAPPGRRRHAERRVPGRGRRCAEQVPRREGRTAGPDPARDGADDAARQPTRAATSATRSASR